MTSEIRDPLKTYSRSRIPRVQKGTGSRVTLLTGRLQTVFFQSVPYRTFDAKSAWLPCHPLLDHAPFFLQIQDNPAAEEAENPRAAAREAAGEGRRRGKHAATALTRLLHLQRRQPLQPGGRPHRRPLAGARPPTQALSAQGEHRACNQNNQEKNSCSTHRLSRPTFLRVDSKSGLFPQIQCGIHEKRDGFFKTSVRIRVWNPEAWLNHVAQWQ